MGKTDQGVVTLWMAKHYWNQSLKYIGYGGTGKQVRDILHVEDLVDLIDLQIHEIEKFERKIYNVGGGIENNADRAYVEPSLSLRDTWGSPAARLKPYVELTYDPRIHDTPVDRNGQKRNSQGVGAALGVTLQDGPIWTGDFSANFIARRGEIDVVCNNRADPQAGLQLKRTVIKTCYLIRIHTRSQWFATGQLFDKLWCDDRWGCYFSWFAAVR